MLKKYLTLRNIRRIYSIFFFILFLLLLAITNFRHMKGYEVSLFLEVDPLISISSFLTSGTIYKGLIFSLLLIIPTMFLGRFFCSWICPLGILNHWISHFFNKRRPVDEYKVNAYRKIYRLKYYILTALIVLALLGTLQVGLLDPIALITRSFVVSVYPGSDFWYGSFYLKQPLFYGGLLITIIFLAIMFLNRFMTRLWCRVLCPLGALLGILSSGAFLRIRRDVDLCNDCQKCLQYCQGGCEPHGILRQSECHLCMNCIEQCPEDAIHYGFLRKMSSIHKPFDINRRRLIETAISGVILFPMMRSSVNSSLTPQSNVIRPPGSINEEDFLRRCIKCGECMQICPTNVLQPAMFEAGFEGLWSPVLKNKIGYCEHSCILCSQVCPTGAIVPLTIEEKTGREPFKKPVTIGTAFYDRGRCLPWAMNIECIVCEEVCPTSPKAIWFKTVEIKLRDGTSKRIKLPHLEPKLCIGCGICENKCPVRDYAAIRVTSVGETRSKNNRMILPQKWRK